MMIKSNKLVTVFFLLAIGAVFFYGNSSITMFPAAQAEQGHAHDEKGHGDGDEHKDKHEGKHEGKHEDAPGDKHNEAGHGDTQSNEHGDEHGGDSVNLAENVRNAADIKVMAIEKRLLGEEITAPGEVIVNKYESTKITPRITAQVIKRHKKLGDHVQKNQSLVTLTSVEMAQAQGDLLVTNREWRRVKKLGKNVVSDRRFTEAKIDYQQAYAKVLAYGMSDAQIKALLKHSDIARMSGVFDLIAQQQGTIISDEFVVGELIEPGRVLYEITNEKVLWVEAKISPQDASTVAIDAPARVRVGDDWVLGRVVQIHHKLDEQTRTFPVRIEVSNEADLLHPGLFVDTRIQSSNQKPVLALPQEAVLRSPDGDWIVFVELEPGQYKLTEIDRVRVSGDQVIIRGLKPNTRVVVQGAFFIQSELAKSGFDVHNH